MTITQAGAAHAATIEALRTRMRGLEAPVVDASGLPTPMVLRDVLPSLRIGAVHSVEPRSLALLCLAAAMPEGGWSAIVGMPDVGVEAAADAGVAIDRLVLVPRPGRTWSDAVASFAEVMPVVLAAAPSSVAPAEASRLEARLRAAGSCLIVHGAWPAPATRIRRVDVAWRGLESGLGRIARADADLEVTGTDRVPRRARISLASED